MQDTWKRNSRNPLHLIQDPDLSHASSIDENGRRKSGLHTRNKSWRAISTSTLSGPRTPIPPAFPFACPGMEGVVIAFFSFTLGFATCCWEGAPATAISAMAIAQNSLLPQEPATRLRRPPMSKPRQRLHMLKWFLCTIEGPCEHSVSQLELTRGVELQNISKNFITGTLGLWGFRCFFNPQRN